ncbi:S1C family serine protease [uncultured Lutibacter sp.]|uniref:S1C family serine protease n=1 Tax=uncultured Lutibacter sp. TaxID=437739 RepID=UPI0026314FBE|nr:S1C family serine protease [uncultured Lutibacter sp.]
MTKKYLLLILTIIPLLTFSQSAKEIAKNCLPSTVSLVMEDKTKQPISLGSGFVLENGKVVTNLHVIEGAKYGYVLENGSSKKHSIKGYFQIDKTNDLAILSVPTLTAQPLAISTLEKPEIGEKVYAIGNPKGLSGTISEGIVSGIRSMENKSLIQITAPISPGSSGGPVINNKGEVIGVAVGTLTSGQNLNFAIPVNLLKDLANKDTSTISTLNISEGTTSPKTSKDEINVKDGVIIRKVECHNFFGAQVSFSIKNNLPHTISDVRILFLLYDNTGTVIDYVEQVYLKTMRWEKDGIKPFLAKSFGYQSGSTGTEFQAEYKSGYRIKPRILDFKIQDE